MKKRLTAGLCMAAAAMLLAGCGKQAADTIVQTEIEDRTKVETELPETPDVEDLKIKLGDYKNIEVTIQAIPDISDEDVENQISAMVTNGVTQTEVTDRPVADGDLVKVDYEAMMDGQPVAGEAENDYNILIGSGVFFDGAESRLIGAMPGDIKEVEVTYPESYPNEALAGKTAVYKVTVKSILEEGKAELTDAYVTEVSGGACKNVEEFRVYLKESLQEGVDAQNELLAQQAVWDKLIDETVIENYPEDLLKAKEDAYIKSDEASAEFEGMTLDEYIETYMGMTVEEYHSQIADEVERTAKKAVIAEAVASKEGIVIETLSEEDWTEAARWFGYEDAGQLKADYTEEDIKAELTLKQVTELMMETAKVNEATGEAIQ